MNTTELEAKMRPGKIQVPTEFEPMTSAVEETNIEAILTVMNTAKLVVKIRPKKKFRPTWNAVFLYDFHLITVMN